MAPDRDADRKEREGRDRYLTTVAFPDLECHLETDGAGIYDRQT